MTPTGRNRLFELLMAGAKPAMRGDEPAQTGEMIPLARYDNGGVFPAVHKRSLRPSQERQREFASGARNSSSPMDGR